VVRTHRSQPEQNIVKEDGMPHKAATISIENFSPLNIKTDAKASTRVRADQYVQVYLPRIKDKKNPDRKLPRLGIQINVRSEADECKVEDVISLLTISIQDLQRHWENRKTEINTGIYIGDERYFPLTV
jgi:hypothetical protein